VVMLLQDGVSQPDVQFYTEIDNVDCVDRRDVSALCMRKPISIHPIRFTTKYYIAVANLEKCYEDSLDDDYACLHPFMVFCSSVVFAEFLVHRLQAKATEAGGDPKRIKGMWGAIRSTDPFCREFAKAPNEVGQTVDVVVCTSVIGVGFSISQHFQSFHAFLFNRILTHTDELQFIRRIRFVMDSLPDTAIRQSYLYVEPASGEQAEYTAVLEDFKAVRNLMLRSDSSLSQGQELATLETTLARVRTETEETAARHDNLWREWAKNIESEFVEMDTEMDDDGAEKQVKRHLGDFANSRKRDIAALLTGNDMDDIGTLISQMEVGSGMPMYRASFAQEANENLSTAFLNEELAKALIHLKHGEGKALTDVMGSPSSIKKLIKQSKSLACWIHYSHRHLGQEESGSFWDHLREKKYNQGAIKMTSHLLLGEYLLPRILAPITEEERLPYLKEIGSSPFFNGAAVSKDQSLCDFFKAELEQTDNDTPATIQRKAGLLSCAKVMLNEHTNKDTKIAKLYECPKTAHMFVKTMLQKLGLKMLGTTKRSTNRTLISRMVTQGADLALVFALKHCFRDKVVGILPELLSSGNLSAGDKEWVEDTIHEFNGAVAQLGLNNTWKIHPPGHQTIAPTAGRRTEECRQERIAAADSDIIPTANNEAEHRRTMSILIDAIARTDDVEAAVRQNQHQNDLARTAAMVVHEEAEEEEEEEEEEDEDEDREDAPNPFLSEYADVQ
jgi:hypothetical protein